ncbi:mycothiol conjugate amidase Mca [Lacisediminihabitans sp. H27-G8]|uniref:mycothiol conjugate amidase Mca n=1 Tax=Lacisediminihabitans sp. H27-G8 TaxID=3111909 RepID=UPI0038FC4C83
MTQRLLAVHAHPDDESSKGAATYAHYRSIGTEVLVVSCTGGERGDIQNEALESSAMANRDMAGLRRIEMANAQAAIGFEHRWLGYQDSGLPENDEPVPANSFALIPLEISAEPLVKIIREFRPQVLVTYDETGGYPHPDHIRTHDISLYAYEAAADASRYPDAGAPWQISKVYFDRIFNAPRIEAMYQFLLVNAPETPQLAQMQEFRERMKDRPVLTTTQVPVGDFFDARDTALRAHASQVAPDSAFFFWPNDLQRQAWPFEDFQLALSLVDSPLPETDLFSGIPAEDLSA